MLANYNWFTIKFCGTSLELHLLALYVDHNESNQSKAGKRISGATNIRSVECHQKKKKKRCRFQSVTAFTVIVSSYFGVLPGYILIFLLTPGSPDNRRMQEQANCQYQLSNSAINPRDHQTMEHDKHNYFNFKS